MGCSSSTNANSGGGTAQKQDPPAENQGGEQQAAEQTAAEGENIVFNSSLPLISSEPLKMKRYTTMKYE